MVFLEEEKEGTVFADFEHEELESRKRGGVHLCDGWEVMELELAQLTDRASLSNRM